MTEENVNRCDEEEMRGHEDRMVENKRFGVAIKKGNFRKS